MLDIDHQDEVCVRVETARVETIAVDGYDEALNRLQEFENVRSFSYRNGDLEVVIDGR